MRAFGVPLGALMVSMATARRRWFRPGPPAKVFSPYSGSKQPPSRPANAKAVARGAKRETVERGLGHHIHDPLRHDDDLFRALAVEGSLYRIQGQDSSLDLGAFGVARDGHVGPFLTVNLHR